MIRLDKAFLFEEGEPPLLSVTRLPSLFSEEVVVSEDVPHIQGLKLMNAEKVDFKNTVTRKRELFGGMIIQVDH